MQGVTRAELDSFPGFTVLRRSATEESGARAVLLEAAGGFTPRIEVQGTTASAFVMVLDMTGTKLMFGPPQKIGSKAIAQRHRLTSLCRAACRQRQLRYRRLPCAFGSYSPDYRSCCIMRQNIYKHLTTLLHSTPRKSNRTR